jgi:hypothetical protein
MFIMLNGRKAVTGDFGRSFQNRVAVGPESRNACYLKRSRLSSCQPYCRPLGDSGITHNKRTDSLIDIGNNTWRHSNFWLTLRIWYLVKRMLPAGVIPFFVNPRRIQR